MERKTRFELATLTLAR